MLLRKIASCYGLNLETPIPSTLGKSKSINIIRNKNGLDCVAGSLKIFYSWEHILKSINEIHSFSLSHKKCPIRIGGQAVSYKNHNYPKESIDGFVRYNGPEKHVDTMQGNIFTAILVNAGLGCVEKDQNLKRMPKVFIPNDLFFANQSGNKESTP